MCNRFISLILFAIFVGYGITPAAMQPMQEDLDSEEYAVYSALINSITSRIPDAAILIHDRTLTAAGEELHMDGGVEAEVRADFIAKSHKSHQLKSHFTLTKKYELIQGGAPGLQRSVIVIGLSRVGMNRAEGQAIVRIRYRGMGGMGWKDQLVMLSKREGGWEVERKMIRMVP